MQREYLVVYEKSDEGWIVATAPELPGAFSQGRTMEEARFMIKDAIALLLESYRERGLLSHVDKTVVETVTIEVPAA
jgi:predicted RNase H-like HicB family nuclease